MKKNGVPDLFIEKLLLDELPQIEKERLLADPAVRRRLDELKAENQRILAEYPPAEMAKAVRNRAERGREPEVRRANRKRSRPAPTLRFVPVATFALLVLVAGVFLVIRGPEFFSPQGQGAETRLKGGEAFLNVYMKTDAGGQLLAEGQRVSEGTTLQVGYVAGSSAYGVILSIDGRGTITQHYPLSAVTGTELEREGEVLLPFAYTLDDAPGFERFFLVVSKKSFAVDRVIEAAEELSEQLENAKSQDLRLPRGLEQSSILLLK
jgi:hypothetical protein